MSVQNSSKEKLCENCSFCDYIVENQVACKKDVAFYIYEKNGKKHSCGKHNFSTENKIVLNV